MACSRFFILGNGGAAIHAIMALRAAGFDGDIHQISDTPGPAFNPMLSPYYLKGKISWENCFPYEENFYDKYRVICHMGRAVQKLDPYSNYLETVDGKRFEYDKCLIATGARPVIPPVPGLQDSPHALPLRDAQSTLKMMAKMAQSRKIMVLGASFIGLELTEIFTSQGKEVILLDVADQLVPRGAHRKTAEQLNRYLTENGVDVRLGCTLEGLEGAPDGAVCHFPESIIEEADFVAVCTGICPNIDFIDTEQVKVGQAIIVDAHMKTNVPNLYAAGDACQCFNRLSGESQWMGTWANACYQGRTAGLHMMGKPARFEGALPQHITPLFQWTYAQIGDVHRSGDTVRIESNGDPFKGSYCLKVFDGGKLVGANLINSPEKIAPAVQAISRGLNSRSEGL